MSSEMQELMSKITDLISYIFYYLSLWLKMIATLKVRGVKGFEDEREDSVKLNKQLLFNSAILEYKTKGIPYRCLRTRTAQCKSDFHFLVKLHCIRLAFHWMFKDIGNWQWFVDKGRQVLTDILFVAHKDPKELLIAYEDMMQFLEEKESWEMINHELRLRGVKAMTFYDVVLDYILLDAFDDLDSPPTAVSSLVKNQWLTNTFKESALNVAIWSGHLAQRHNLTYPNGFMSHLYSITEQVLPLLAWGFFGPDNILRHACQYFKGQVLRFVTDIFSSEKTRFTTVDELSKDILEHIDLRIAKINRKLSAPEELISNQSYSVKNL